MFEVGMYKHKQSHVKMYFSQLDSKVDCEKHMQTNKCGLLPISEVGNPFIVYIYVEDCLMFNH